MKNAFLATMFLFLAAGSVNAQVLDFENINPNYPQNQPFAMVNDFYNGGLSSLGTSGTNFGVTFSPNAEAICLNTIGFTCSNTSRGGLAPGSDRGALFFLSGGSTFMNRAGGFQNGFSFFYTAINQGGSFNVWSGLSGTGLLLASLNLPTTPSNCDIAQWNAGFCPFIAAGVNFAGVAQSVVFAGVQNQIVFDDVTFGSSTPGQVPEPVSLFLVATGLFGLAATRRRRNRKNLI